VQVAVTGGSGFVGRALLGRRLLGGLQAVPMAWRYSAADQRLTTAALAGNTSAVVHLAGLTRARDSWQRPLEYFRANASGTTELLQVVIGADVGRFVLASTGAIYGSPERQPMDELTPDEVPHPYAGSKLAAELAVEAQARSGNVGAVILRLFNVAGPGDSDPTRLVPRVLAVAAGEAPVLEVNGDGSAVRDYVHVEDVAEAFLAAVDAAEVGQARRYNIGSGVGTSVMDVVAAVERVTGRSVPVKHNPPAAEPPVLVCDPSKAMRELGWRPWRSDIDTIVRDAWVARGGTPVA
jgi:UDP-glucose 4-epimerase